MKRLAKFSVLLALAVGGATSPAQAFQVQCQQGMYKIFYYSEYGYPPIVGTEVFYCDGSSQLVGHIDAYADVQFCELCP